MIKKMFGALARLERRYYAIGLAGLLVGAIGIYVTLRQPRTEVTFDVANELNVLDIRASIPELSITFNGEDLAATSQNLRLLSIRVSNTGDTNILQGQYATDVPWGFRVSAGRVVQVPHVVDATSPYLRDNLQPSVRDGNQIIFNKVILDRGAGFLIQLGVMHPKSTEPEIIPIGKIAGMEGAVVTRSWQTTAAPSAISQAVGGPAFVQALRIAIYPIGSLFGLLAFIGAIAAIGSWNDRRKQQSRRTAARPLATLAFKGQPKFADLALQIYAEGGRAAVKQTLDFLLNPQSDAFPGPSPDWEQRFERGELPPDVRFEVQFRHQQQHWEIVRSLLAIGAVAQSEQKTVSVEPAFRSGFEHFYQSLDALGEATSGTPREHSGNDPVSPAQS